MTEMETFVRVLLAIAAGIVTIGGAVAFVEHIAEKASKHNRELAEQVESHEERLLRDHKRLNDLESSSRLIMRGVMQLMSHEVDGNHTQQLKDVRNEMQEYLINR